MTNQTGSTLALRGDQHFWSPEQLAALAQIGVQNAPAADLAVFLNFAQRTGLDPFARQIYMIGRNAKTGNGWSTKWTIQASIDGLRIVAERSGDYAGQTPVEYCGEDGVWRDVWAGSKPPVAARVGVLRHGFDAPLYAVAYFDEYVQTDREGRPTSMWASKPRLMLAKCAEALALRKAFPNDLAGLYTADEMGHAETRLQAHAVSAPAEVQVVEAVADVITGEVVEEAAPQQPAETPAPVETPAPAASGPAASDAQLRAIAAMLSKCGIKDREVRHMVISKIIDRYVAESHELTKAEAHRIIEAIKPLAEAADPVEAFKQAGY